MIETPLVCHPATPAPWLEGIVVQVAADQRMGMTLVYTVRGDLGRLLLPPPAVPVRVDGLWRHTCCEAFVRGAETAAYREYNFAPSGAWQAYDFEAYRRGGAPARTRPPRITCTQSGDRLTLTVHLARSDLPPGQPIELALSAVIEDRAGRLSYWALTHPAAYADFHHPDAFTLELDRMP